MASTSQPVQESSHLCDGTQMFLQRDWQLLAPDREIALSVNVVNTCQSL